MKLTSNRLKKITTCLNLGRFFVVIIACSTIGSIVTGAPITVFYSKDAQTTNTVPSGTKTPDILFSTPIQGISALTYTQDPETVAASGGGATASTTYSGSIAPGILRAASSSAVTGLFSGTAGEGLISDAHQVLWFSDTLTANGGNVGSPVSLTLTLNMDTLLTSFNVPTNSNPALCGYGGIALSTSINANSVASLGRDICSGSNNQSTTVAFNTTVGTPFSLKVTMDILTQSAIGASDRAGSSVGIDALNTGEVFLRAPTGIQLTSTSGYSYLQTDIVPEPGTFVLASISALGLATLHLVRRKSRHSQP